MNEIRVDITGIGLALPQHQIQQKDLPNFLSNTLLTNKNQVRKLEKIFKESGIINRHTIIPELNSFLNYFQDSESNSLFQSFDTQKRMEIYKDNALPLAMEAVNQCLNSSVYGSEEKSDVNKINVSSITHLITVSCTGMYAPGLDIDLVQNLGLSTHVQRMCINFMGCYGVFNALKCAQAICIANNTAKVLIVSVELCSIHVQKLDTVDGMISTAIFSDGAGALLLQANAKQKKKFSLKHFYCDLLTEGEKEMAWSIGNHGYDIVLSSYVPKLIQKGIHDFLTRLLSKSSETLSSCRYFAIHPGGKRILDVCRTALNLQVDDLKFSYQTLQECGNMSSATIIFVLKKIWDQLKSEDDKQTIMACAFGPGLTLESMSLTAHYV